MARKRPNPSDELAWREWVTFTLGRHEAMLKVLLALSSGVFTILIFLINLILTRGG